jgi:hypothetical protein
MPLLFSNGREAMKTIRASVLRSSFVWGPIILALVAARHPQLLLGLIILAAAASLLLLCRAWLFRKHVMRHAIRINKRLKNAPCRYLERYGTLADIKVIGSLLQPHILVGMNLFAEENHWHQLVVDAAVLQPPKPWNQITSFQAWITMLHSGGIELLAEQSVEAKITSAAVNCIQEARRSEQALQQLQELREPLMLTLEQARGNALLESSIPNLQQAQEALRREERQLRTALGDALARLQTLREVLMVPERIRPILNCDLEELLDTTPHERLHSLVRDAAA